MCNYCKSCGAPIPSGQRFCSMCYGDPSYGRDGYAEEYLRRQQEEWEENRRQELEYERMMMEEEQL